MKRNMELVRELFLRVETEQGFDSLTSKYSQKEIVGACGNIIEREAVGWRGAS